jgi:hypothetical protein
VILHIEQLRLRLPAGYEHRALRIAHEVAALLAEADAGAGRSRALLRVPPLRINAAASDRDVARAIATGLRSSLQARGG